MIRPDATNPPNPLVISPRGACIPKRSRAHPKRAAIAWALVLVSASFASQTSAFSSTNAVLFFQGRLVAGTTGFNGPGHFKFAIVDASGSRILWRNSPDSDADSQPDLAVTANVRTGLYGIHLGDTNLPNMAAIPASVFITQSSQQASNPLHLRVWFHDGTGPFEQLSPDQRISEVAFAVAAHHAQSADHAQLAESVPDAAITADKIAPGAIVANRISGTLLPQQLPPLDAAKITSGILDAARLPADLAYKSLDLRNATNALLSEIAGLRSHIEALEIRIAELESESGGAGGGGGTPTPALAGTVRTSSKASDPTLALAGYSRFAEIPAPAWTPGAVSNAPSARYGSVAAWLPGSGSWLVWGGQTAANTFVASGGVYDPKSDAWRALPSLDAPSVRRGGVAVSNGAGKVFVWGGATPSGFADSGSFFDTSTFSWRRMSFGNQPSPRDGHVGFFTGSALILWGGRDFRGSLGDGAAYHAELQTWSPLPESGAPTPRSAAAAVWTGNYGLIWGGLQGTVPLDSGARLVVGGTAQAPTYAWQTMTTVGAPSPRVGMATAWTGSRWLVWGGRAGDTFLADGASYDPASDTWSPLPASGAPVARAGAHAFWTGSEFVVLGGESNGGPVTDGAALDPVAGNWRRLENSGDPGRRLEAVAAWSGSEVLLFGGRDGRTPLAALQRLEPTPSWYLYRKL